MAGLKATTTQCHAKFLKIVMCVNDILYMTANLGLALTVLNFIHNMSHGNDKFGTVIMSAKMQLKKEERSF